MESLVVKLLADAFIAILLLATIIYSWKLNKRIRVLQDSKGEMAKLIERFDRSTEQASKGINEIHKISKSINDHIENHIAKANYIADDLAFMIEKGTTIVNKAGGEVSLPAEDKPTRGGGRASATSASAGGASSRRSSSRRGAAPEADIGIENSSADLDEGTPLLTTPAAGKSNITGVYNRDAEREAMIAEAKSKGRKMSARDAIARIAKKDDEPAGAGGAERLRTGASSRRGRAARSQSEQELLDALKNEY